LKQLVATSSRDGNPSKGSIYREFKTDLPALNTHDGEDLLASLQHAGELAL